MFSPYAYSYFNPLVKFNGGGAELQLYYLSTELAQDRRFEVHVVVDLPRHTEEVREGVKLHGLPMGSRGNVKYVRALTSALRLFRLLGVIDADIYIQRAASFQTGIICLFCKIKGKKFVYMVANDGDTNPPLNPYRKWIVRRMFWWVYEWGLKHADLVVVQNKRQQEDLRRNYGRIGAMRHSAHRIPEYGAEDPRKFILWVARGEDFKQPELFLELAKEFLGEQFVMVMPRSPRFKGYWTKVYKQATQCSNVIFYEYVAPHEINDLFRRAKVFVNTSTSEGFPNTLIQAAKSKTPLLSFSVDPDRVLETYHIGINAHEDREKLKEGLRALLEDESLWKEMATNAYRYVKEHHDIKKGN